MNTRPNNTEPNIPRPTVDKRPALLWELNRILQSIGASNGAFRAITGRWPAQLADDELTAWIEWFAAPTGAGEQLPPLPLQQGAPVEQPRDRASDGNSREQRRAPGSERGGFSERPPAAPRATNDHRGSGGPPTRQERPPQPARPAQQAKPAQPAQPSQQQPPQPSQQQPPQPSQQQPPQPSQQQPAPEKPAAEGKADLTDEESAFIEAVRSGAQIREAAQRAGLSVSTLYQRRTRKPAFADAWQSALAERDAMFGGNES